MFQEREREKESHWFSSGTYLRFFLWPLCCPPWGMPFTNNNKTVLKGHGKDVVYVLPPTHPPRRISSFFFFFLLRGIASPPTSCVRPWRSFAQVTFVSSFLCVCESVSPLHTDFFFFCWVLGVRLEKGFVCVCDSNISSSARLIWHPSAPFCVCVSTEERRGGRVLLQFFKSDKIQVTCFLVVNP